MVVFCSFFFFGGGLFVKPDAYAAEPHFLAVLNAGGTEILLIKCTHCYDS